ncbi:MAG: nucleotidyltransferase domain-containing protein [Candidatus Caldatribacteriaceae bacterium]
MRNFLKDTYGPAFKALILYGSYARGTATEDSDVDFLVVVDDHLDPWEVYNRLSDLLFDLLLETGKLVLAVVVPESHHKHHHSPLMANVRREGIVI